MYIQAGGENDGDDAENTQIYVGRLTKYNHKHLPIHFKKKREIIYIRLKCVWDTEGSVTHNVADTV